METTKVRELKLYNKSIACYNVKGEVIKMQPIETMTLEELRRSDNTDWVEKYFLMLNEFKTDRIAKKILETLEGESIDKIYNEIEKESENYRSYTLFPGDLVLVYPSIKEQRSKIFRTCDFSGAVIHPGSLYVSYRPLLDNITKKEKFVLSRTIQVESGYIHNLPMEIGELEALEQSMKRQDENQEIDFNHLNSQMGGELCFQKLKGRRR